MTEAQTGALAVALAAPVVAALAPGRKGAAVRPAQLGATVAAVAWLVLVVVGANGRITGFHVTPLGAAAGCGAALVTAAALQGPLSRRSELASGTALTAVGLGLTAGGAGLHAVPVVAALAAAAALTVAAMPGRDQPLAAEAPVAPRPPLHTRLGDGRPAVALLAAAGVIACGAGFLAVHSRGDRWSLPTGGTQSTTALTAFLGAAALLSVAGALGRRGPPAVLLAGGMAVGLSAAPLQARADGLDALVVALAAAAVVAAGVRRATVSLALLSLAAAAGPAALTPTARLLAAAAVVSVAVDLPWAWLAAVPAGVSLAAGVIDDGSRLALALALAAAVVAALLAVAASEQLAGTRPAAEASGARGAPGDGGFRAREPGGWPALSPGGWPALSPGAWPALAVGLWLVVAPGTWTWTGAGLDMYDQGMGRAVGAGLLGVVAWLLLAAPPRARPEAPAEDPELSLTLAARTPPRRQLVRSEGSASTPRPRRAFRSQRSRPRWRASARARRQPPGRQPPQPPGA